MNLQSCFLQCVSRMMSSPLPVKHRGMTPGAIQVPFREWKVFCCLLFLHVLLAFSHHLASNSFFRGLLLNHVLLVRVASSHQWHSNISSGFGGSSAPKNNVHFLSLQQELKLWILLLECTERVSAAKSTLSIPMCWLTSCKHVPWEVSAVLA